MFDLLIARNYRVRPQMRAGAHRIDFVVEGAHGPGSPLSAMATASMGQANGKMHDAAACA